MPKLVIDKMKAASNVTLNIGKRIAYFRKKRGLTQQELADKIGIDRTVIANYELSRARIYDEIIARLAVALKISADVILGIKDSTTPKNDNPTLKVMKRMRKIEELPASKQKIILRNIDLTIAGFKKD